MIRSLPFLTLAACLLTLTVPRDAAAQSGAGEPMAFGYARLGYGAAVAERPSRAPAIGFGFRGEGERFALDVSIFNVVVNLDTYRPGSSELLLGSRLKLAALKFLSPRESQSAYVGGGLSWGVATMSRTDSPSVSASSWHGSGLQAELITGYEIGRTSDMRLFVQGDASLPLFRTASFTWLSSAASRDFTADTDYRYLPSAVISLGIGWRGRR